MIIFLSPSGIWLETRIGRETEIGRGTVIVGERGGRGLDRRTETETEIEIEIDDTAVEAEKGEREVEAGDCVCGRERKRVGGREHVI